MLVDTVYTQDVISITAFEIKIILTNLEQERCLQKLPALLA